MGNRFGKLGLTVAIGLTLGTAGSARPVGAEPAGRRKAVAQTTVEQHLSRAREHAAVKRYDDAIREYAEALRMQPQLTAALNGIQEVSALRDKTQAARLANEAHRHLLRRQNEQAKTKALAALNLDPDNDRAHAVLGNALIWLDTGGASAADIKKAFETALRLNQGLPLTYVGSGVQYWLQGVEGTRLKDPGASELYEKAESAFRDAISRDPNDILALNNLGVAYWARGLGPDAEREYRKALALDPELDFAHFNLGLVLLKNGKASQAEKSFRSAIALDPKNSTFHTWLGFSLWEQGRREEARAALREAGRLGGKDARIDLILSPQP